MQSSSQCRRPVKTCSWSTTARLDALHALTDGRAGEAIAILKNYDRLLERTGHLERWFDNRLELLAAHAFSGRTSVLPSLAGRLEERARTARDWLTLRRLGRILESGPSRLPLPLLSDPDIGPFASRSSTAAVGIASRPDAPETVSEPAGAAQPAAPSPLHATITGFFQRLGEISESPAAEARSLLLSEILSVNPADVGDPREAGALLYLLEVLGTEDADLRSLWDWATRAAQPFREHAGVLSQLAGLGARWTADPDSVLCDVIARDELGRMFRRSLDLDRDAPASFARAAAYYLQEGDLGEAERCLARGFRLDRTSTYLAIQLCDVYQNSERPRDALAVLDLALRAGSRDPDVLWRASNLASHLGQWEPMLSYLDHFEAASPGRPWTCYQRAFGLLELNRAAEALEAAEEEMRRSPESPFPAQVLAAAAVGSLGEQEQFHQRLRTVLDVRLADVDALTTLGLVRLYERLWKSAAGPLAGDPLLLELEDLLLASGLAPNDLFGAARQSGEMVPDVNFYECAVEQSLDADWPGSAECLAGEAGWSSYDLCWGVLVRDEDECGSSSPSGSTAVTRSPSSGSPSTQQLGLSGPGGRCLAGPARGKRSRMTRAVTSAAVLPYRQ